jgi:hypothetical protein
MSQFEQENDLGRGGGEVDDETMEAAERTAAQRRSTANAEGPRSDVVPSREDEDDPQPTARFTGGGRVDGDDE